MTTYSTIAIDFLEEMKTNIESMDKHNQVEILKILTDNNCKVNENKSGVYVNISYLDKETLDKLSKYINYINEQETNLQTMEYQKQEFQKSFFHEKEDKDNLTLSYNR